MSENKKLPDDFLTEGLELANGAQIFGIPLHELTFDELLAVAAQGWHAETKAREREKESSKQHMKRLFSLYG